MAPPLISVILPFFNNASTLKKAAGSILRQTVQDLELIMIDDGSDDESYFIAKSIKDSRMRLFQNNENRGVSYTRNRGIQHMQGSFMALMDADDYCPPERLEMTLNKLRKTPSLGFCGGWTLWKGWSRFPFVGRQPTGPAAVKAYTLYGMPAQADALIFRSNILREHNIRFDEKLRYSEDFDFLLQCLRVADGDNVPAVVLHYKRNPSGAITTRTRKDYQYRLAVLRSALEQLVSSDMDESTVLFHNAVGNGTGAETIADLQRAREWLEYLDHVNSANPGYKPDGLRIATAHVWFRCCRNSAHLGSVAWREWKNSRWSAYYHPTMNEVAAMGASWILKYLLPSRRHAQGYLPGFTQNQN